MVPIDASSSTIGPADDVPAYGGRQASLAIDAHAAFRSSMAALIRGLRYAADGAGAALPGPRSILEVRPVLVNVDTGIRRGFNGDRGS
jgi:hypothetical protein